MAVVTNMLALLVIFEITILANGIPIDLNGANSAQEKEAFAQNLLECVKEKRAEYSPAAQTFSKYDYE